MIARWDDTARATGAKIVSFCGHDSVPWDLSVAELARAMRKRGEELSSVECFDEVKGGVSGGTLATMMLAISGGIATEKRSCAPMLASTRPLRCLGDFCIAHTRGKRPPSALTSAPMDPVQIRPAPAPGGWFQIPGQDEGPQPFFAQDVSVRICLCVPTHVSLWSLRFRIASCVYHVSRLPRGSRQITSPLLPSFSATAGQWTGPFLMAVKTPPLPRPPPQCILFRLKLADGREPTRGC